ncbi:MAG: hypothetical protein U0237_14795 [Thermoleophilia bacterium]
MPFDELPLLVEVVGGPEVQEPIWEVLRLNNHALLPTSVVRVVSIDGGSQEVPHLKGTSLLWIGSRPWGDADIPRFRVASAVLPTTLDPTSALALGGIQTDASQRLFESSPAYPSEAGLILHIDAHGLSGVHPSGRQLVDPALLIALRGPDGPSYLHERQLLAFAEAVQCDVFITNACFGAQQRGMLRMPFPGRLVESSIKLAIAAREPLRASTAERFFGGLYRYLAQGVSAFEAFHSALQETAGGSSTRLALDPDGTARELLQPVFWAGSHSDVSLRLIARLDEAPTLSQGGREVISLGTLGSTVGRFLTELEDLSRDGCDVTVLQVRGLDGEATIYDDIMQALRNVWTGGSPERHSKATSIVLPPIGDSERLALVTARFDGPSAVIDLLASVAVADLDYLDRLRVATDGSAAAALIRVLSWGTQENRLPYCARLEQYLTGLLETLVAENSQLGRRDLAWPIAAGFALPASTARGAELGVPLPWWGAVLDRHRHHVVDQGDAWLHRGEGLEVLEPTPGVGMGARAWLDPAAAVLGWSRDVMQSRSGSAVQQSSWDPLTKLSCASALAVAVAHRQLGRLPTYVTVPFSAMLSSIDIGSAGAILRALVHPASGWPDLDADEHLAATRLASALESGSTGETPVHRAQTALREGRWTEIPEILGDEPMVDFSASVFRAYAHLNAGEIGLAKELIAPWIHQLQGMTRHDQGELLHLLGSIAAADKNTDLAIAYFMDERSLAPPHPLARLHNREHLLEVLRQSPKQNTDLALEIAAEAVELALLHADGTRSRQAMREWARQSLRASSEAGREFAERYRRTPQGRTVSALTLVALADGGGRDDPRRTVEVLEALTFRGGWEAAVAANMLAASDYLPTRHRTIAALERGAQHRDLEGAACLRNLLSEYWQAGADEDFRRVAATLGEMFPALGYANLAALAVRHGNTAEAFDLLVQAGRDMDLGELRGALHPTIGRVFPELMVPSANFEAVRPTWDQILLCMRGGHDPSEVVDLLPRVLTLYEHLPEVDNASAYRSDAEMLVAMSEWLWDGEELEAASRCRATACELLRRTGDEGMLAVELGWLGALHRLRGALAEAELCHVEAVELGKRLGGSRYAATLSKYANLLHEMENYSAAVHVRWRAICVECMDLQDEAEFTPAALRQALQWWPRTDVATWALGLANFANCLLDAGDVGASESVVDRADMFLTATAQAGDGTDRNRSTAVAMVARVRARQRRPS